MQLNRVTAVDDRVPVKNALVSVADKSGLEPFVEKLWRTIPDLTIYSTGGTYTLLASLAERLGRETPALLPRLRSISSYTGQPEMQGGLVKTLDFRVYLGLLSERYNQDHQADLARTGAVPFDMTVCSFYPFENTAERPDATLEDLRSNIDIGGPTMLRASAKNYLRVLPVCRSEDYDRVLEELKTHDGRTPLAFRLAMALEAFRCTARYEEAITRHLARVAGETDPGELYSTEPAEAGGVRSAEKEEK